MADKTASGSTASRTVTMTDVAAHAGVSIATVSRVLSDSRPVAEPLRRAVLDASHELGYQVNLVGRALRKGRTATVGLLVPDLDNPFFSSLAQHMSAAFEGSDTDMLVFSTCGDTEVERRGVESFLGRQVDAIVMIPCHEVDSAGSIRRAARANLTIQLDRNVVDAEVHFVGCDNEAGIRLIADHLRAVVDEEEQPIMYIGARAQSSAGHERYHYFTKEFPGRPTHLGSFDFGWGQRAVDQILTDGFRRGAIVAAADNIALGALARLYERGFRVPEDFRVVGFDGIGVARFAYPTLTTVRQPVEEIAGTVLDLVLAPDPQGAIRTIHLRPEFVPGATSPQ